jgi:UPF0271 protein
MSIARHPRLPDLNCDLGEHEPARVTLQLMRHISSCNIACGGHAGSVKSMLRCARLAKERGVHIGAHPGIAAGFGRTSSAVSVEEFSTLVMHQVGALDAIARQQKSRIHHIKLHGALYHAVEQDRSLRRAYISLVKAYWPRVWIYCLSGGKVARDAEAAGIRAKHEVFLDRNYRSDGSLVPRSEPDAVITEPGLLLDRVRRLLQEGVLHAIDGTPLKLQADTCCVHGDTAGAAALLGKAAAILKG